MVGANNNLCCLNPDCQKPHNIQGTKYCQSCGTELTILRNHYRPIKLISDEGGFGRTYLAEDIDKLDEKCVIKQFVPKTQGSQAIKKAKELFAQEARQLQQLGKHPQIPYLIAYFSENGYMYLVQEYIEGKPLDKLFFNQGCWNERQVRDFLGDILPILEFIHQHKVIHRDIKPPNIMCRDLDSKFVLIDFGASKDLAATVAAKGTQIGTFGYSAFEQMRGGEAYQSSDLYSIGVTCFYLLTKVSPNQLFLDQGYQWVEDWQKHLQQSISPQLREVLGKLLPKKRHNRYQTAAEVIAALKSPQPKPQPKPQPQPQPQPQSQQKTSPSLPPPKTITRGEFLKFLGYLGTGVLATVGISTILNQEGKNSTEINNKPEDSPQPSPSNSPTPETVNPPARKEQPTFSFETVTVNERGEIKNHTTKQAQYFRVNLPGNISLDMVKIPGGRFLMGSPENEKGRYDNESPQHWVTVPEFYMGKYEVTQEQWQAIMGNNPSYFKGVKRPVEKVSWNSCQEFCTKLSEQTGGTFRLPSEAEWEYACRSVTSDQLSVISEELTVEEWNEKYHQPFHFGEAITSDLANYRGTSIYAFEPEGVYRRETTEVGSFPPNAFGLYDMHGNVWEWCEDGYHSSYQGAPQDGSAWLNNNNNDTTKALRSGSWFSIPGYCRAANRLYSFPGDRRYYFGFRVVCVVFPALF